MVAQRGGQSLRPHGQVQIFRDALVRKMEASIAEMTIDSILGSGPLPSADKRGEAIQGLNVEPEDLADFARRQPSAIGADVGGHGSAALSVSLIKILDGFLALVAAGKVEVDIRPFAALFRQEAFKQQIHPHRIDGGNAERVTNRAVGGRTSSLHQEAVFTTERNHVPDNREITPQSDVLCKVQLFNNVHGGAAEQS